MADDKEHLDRRCPMLGGPVPFKYCMKCGDNGDPCWKIIDCWWEEFDIKAYLKDTVSASIIDKIENAKPRPKVSTLVELIEKAESRKK